MKTRVFDIAAYILEKQGSMTTWKLQKLVYYCQAWSLVWDDDVLFDEEIQAWANGPVCRKLYDAHRGQYRIGVIPQGDSGLLTDVQRDTVDRVLTYYGDKSPQWLSDLTHLEKPWREARGDLPGSMRGEQVISKESMAEYYGSL